MTEIKQQRAKLIDIENAIYLQVGSFARVYPIGNEDIERQTAEKTSLDHFLRFEFTRQMSIAWHQGEPVSIGVDHGNYTGVH